jgi:hypothetical protein
MRRKSENGNTNIGSETTNKQKQTEIATINDTPVSAETLVCFLKRQPAPFMGDGLTGCSKRETTPSKIPDLSWVFEMTIGTPRGHQAHWVFERTAGPLEGTGPRVFEETHRHP